MENKLPKVFANKIDKNVGNNENVYHDNDVYHKDEYNDGLTINQKINKIFSSSKYVYKADVEIVLKDGSKVSKKVIGRNKNELITMDSELIKISDIDDIFFSH